MKVAFIARNLPRRTRSPPREKPPFLRSVTFRLCELPVIALFAAFATIAAADFWYQNWIGAATTDINNSGAGQSAKDDALALLSDMGDYAGNPNNYGWGEPIPFSNGGAEGTLICYYDPEVGQWSLYMEIYW